MGTHESGFIAHWSIKVKTIRRLSDQEKQAISVVLPKEIIEALNGLKCNRTQLIIQLLERFLERTLKKRG